MILRKPLAITESRQAFVDDATNTDRKKWANGTHRKDESIFHFGQLPSLRAEPCEPCDRLPRKPSTLRLPFQPLRQNRMFRSRRVTPCWPGCSFAYLFAEPRTRCFCLLFFGAHSVVYHSRTFNITNEVSGAHHIIHPVRASKLRAGGGNKGDPFSCSTSRPHGRGRRSGERFCGVEPPYKPIKPQTASCKQGSPELRAEKRGEKEKEDLCLSDGICTQT